MALDVTLPARRALEIRPVASKRELNTFIKLPWRLYRNEPNWVPPLLFDRKRFFDRNRNPFFKHAEVEFFLAWRDDKPVGRITAHIDRHFNEFQHHDWGMFGFFECENDHEAANALLSAAEEWLRARGRDRMVGPMDFTTNDECGVLVDGYDLLPTVLTNWHHPYYPRLIEGAGLTKAMDLYMWTLEVSERSAVNPVIWRAAADVQRKYGITVRPMRKKDMEAEIGRFLEVYNAAWERNWGFTPLTEEEVRHYAKDLKPVLDENWAFIAEKDGEPVAAALTLPGLQPGPDPSERPSAPVRLGQGALLQGQDRSRPRVRARGQAGVPAHRDRGQAVRDALRRRGAHEPEEGRDRLDPRDQQIDEPGDGAYGRADRPHVPGVREAALKLTAGAVTMSRA